MKTIRFKLFSAFTLLVVLPWILVFSITTFIYTNNLKEKHIADAQNSLAQSLHTFQLNLNVAKRYLDVMFTSEALNTMLTSQDLTVYDSHYRRNVLNLDEYLSSIVGNDDSIAGAVVFVNDKPISSIKFTYWDDSIQQSDFYQRLKRSGGTILAEESMTVKDPYLSDKEFFCLARQIKRIQHTSKGMGWTEEIVGNVVLFLDKEKIFENFDTPLTNKAMTVALSSKSNLVVSNIDDALFSFLLQAVNSRTPKTSESFTEHFPTGEDSLILYAKNEEFTAYAVANRNDFFQNINYFFGIVFLVQIFCGIAFLLFTLITRSLITNPIAKLNQAMVEVTKGNLDVSVHISSKDELRRIGDAFNFMIDELKKQIAQIHENYQEKTSMEIAMLQYQINPHFIYNILSSIRLKALMNQDDSVALMLQRVSRLLRRTIGKSGEDITLHDELTNIDDYIFIHTNIFNTSIASSISVSDELLSCIVPNMLLQPIVENCFVHGIEDINSFCVIIKCKQVENDLVITVSDDGVGVPPETIARILEGTNHKDTYNKIGINSINRRLKLKYGQQYGVTMHSEVGKYTKVTVTLPFRSQLDEEDSL